MKASDRFIATVLGLVGFAGMMALAAVRVNTAQAPAGPFLVWDRPVVPAGHYEVCTLIVGTERQCTDVGATPWQDLKGAGTFAWPLKGLVPAGTLSVSFTVRACNDLDTCVDSDPLPVGPATKPTGLRIKQ
jgi:hypothetical protein